MTDDLIDIPPKRPEPPKHLEGADLERALEAFRNRDEGEKAYRASDFGDAENLLTRFLICRLPEGNFIESNKFKERRPQALGYRGLSRLQVGKYLDARADLIEATKERPTDFLTNLGLGIVSLYIGEVKSAESILQLMLKESLQLKGSSRGDKIGQIMPWYSAVMLNIYGRDLSRYWKDMDKNYKDKLHEFVRLPLWSPENGDIFAEITRCVLQNLESRREQLLPHINYLELLTQMGRFEEALVEAKELTSGRWPDLATENPWYGSVYTNYVTLLLLSRDFVRAKTEIDRLIKDGVNVKVFTFLRSILNAITIEPKLAKTDLMQFHILCDQDREIMKRPRIESDRQKCSEFLYAEMEKKVIWLATTVGKSLNLQPEYGNFSRFRQTRRLISGWTIHSASIQTGNSSV